MKDMLFADYGLKNLFASKAETATRAGTQKSLMGTHQSNKAALFVQSKRPIDFCLGRIRVFGWVVPQALKSLQLLEPNTTIGWQRGTAKVKRCESRAPCHGLDSRKSLPRFNAQFFKLLAISKVLVGWLLARNHQIKLSNYGQDGERRNGSYFGG